MTPSRKNRRWLGSKAAVRGPGGRREAAHVSTGRERLDGGAMVREIGAHAITCGVGPGWIKRHEHLEEVLADSLKVCGRRIRH